MAKLTRPLRRPATRPLTRPLIGAQSFINPLSIGSIIGWYDSADISTITKDGSNLVSTWADKGGAGYNLTSTTTLRPTYTADDGDGLPCITFPDTTQMKNATNTTATEESFFIVVKLGTFAGTTDPIWGRGSGSMVSMTSTDLNWSVTGSVDGVSALRTTPLPVKGQYIILSGRRAASANIYAGGTGNTGLIEVRENGASLKTITHTGGVLTTAMFMGRDNSSNSTVMNAREAVWFGRYLSDAEMTNMENYLNAKWNVYSNFTGREALHRGVKRYCTANAITSLAGLPAPKLLHVIFGQSNAGGEAQIALLSLPVVLQTALTNANIWNPATPAWETLLVGVNNQPNSAAPVGTIKHGTELSWMYDIATDLGASYLIKSFQGGTSLQDRWMPNLVSTNNLWRLMIDRVDLALYTIGFATGLQLNPDVFLWYQGEQDATNGGTYITNYSINEQYMMLTTRLKMFGGSTIKFVVAKVGDMTNQDAGHAAVNAAKLVNASVVPNYTLIEGWTVQSPAGGDHGDSASMVSIGNNVARICGATTQVT